MGLCFSKKKDTSPPPLQPSINSKLSDKQSIDIVPVVAEKKQIISTSHAAIAPPPLNTELVVKEKKKADVPPTTSKKKKIGIGSIGETSSGSSGNVGAATAMVVPLMEDFKPAAVRTSSCTKEEVDAILIQCGRLSRSSSGKAGTENGVGNRRRYSGSKRSYDFDNDKKCDELDEDSGDRPVSRPSPQRRTSGRERSGSRERDGSGRRVSRSPGRRSEAPATSGTTTSNERSRQPAKMVSVPAREKTRGISPAASAGVNKRCASPRSRSPASTCRVSNENGGAHSNGQPIQAQSLSRSSSRKAEQSPYRRNPMAEIDDNTLRGSQNNSKAVKVKDGDEMLKKGNQIQAQRVGAASAAAEACHAVKTNIVLTNCVREQLLSCRAKESEIMEDVNEKKESSFKAGAEISQMIAGENHNTRAVSRSRSSRRSSRDFDNMINPPTYTSLLLEDIQNYHQQHQNLGITLPACVSKACSIVEAVADLNSTSTENKSSEAEKSNNENGLYNGRSGRRGLSSKEPFIESEIEVKDDLLEPSLHKYVTVRGAELEPQESAGSNSFVGQAWSCSWEPRSVDSTDQYWTSKSMNGDEVDQETDISPVVHEYQDRESETRGRGLRPTVSNNSLSTQVTTSATRKRDLLYNHAQLNRAGSGVSGGSARIGGRVNSIPFVVAAAASS